MARVFYGPTVADAAGRVAGSVFSHWRGVQYVKRFAKPGNPNTSLQQVIRNAFKSLTVIWKLLPSEIVSAWTVYAKGKAFTNRNAFLGKGVLPHSADNVYPLAPHNPDEFPMATFTITPGADQLTCNFTFPDALTSNRCRIYYQKQGTNEMVFVAEKLNTDTSHIITGFTGTGTANVWLVKKNNVSLALAASKDQEGTWS